MANPLVPPMDEQAEEIVERIKRRDESFDVSPDDIRQYLDPDAGVAVNTNNVLDGLRNE